MGPWITIGVHLSDKYFLGYRIISSLKHLCDYPFNSNLFTKEKYSYYRFSLYLVHAIHFIYFKANRKILSYIIRKIGYKKKCRDLLNLIRLIIYWYFSWDFAKLICIVNIQFILCVYSVLYILIYLFEKCMILKYNYIFSLCEK